MKWHIVNVVWGEEFLQAFIDISIPSQLSEGNIPDIPDDVHAVYQLYCDKETRKKFMQSRVYQDLTSYIEVKFIEIKIFPHIPNHEILNACHKHALKHAYSDDAVIIFLAPDILFSTQVFSYYYKQLKLGKKLIAGPGIRLSKEGIIHALGKRSAYNTSVLSLPPNELTAMALENLHPLSLALFWENKRISSMCSHLYWWLGENKLLIRAFHIHPFVVHVENKVFPKDTIDGDFICRAIPNRDLWHLIQNTDECVIFEFSKNEQFKDIVMMKPSKWNLRVWVSEHTCSAHHYFARQKFYVGSGLNNTNWQKIENRSDSIVLDSLNFLKVSIIYKKSCCALDYIIKKYIGMAILIFSGKKKITLKKLYKYFFSGSLKKSKQQDVIINL